MKLSEALNLYKLHSAPETLDKHQQFQAEFAKNPGKCAYACIIGAGDGDRAKIIEGGLIECLSKALDDYSEVEDSIGRYTKKIAEEALIYDYIGKTEEQIRAELTKRYAQHYLRGRVAKYVELQLVEYRAAMQRLAVFNSIKPKTLVIQSTDDYMNVIALTQPVNLVRSRFDLAKGLATSDYANVDDM